MQTGYIGNAKKIILSLNKNFISDAYQADWLQKVVNLKLRFVAQKNQLSA